MKRFRVVAVLLAVALVASACIGDRTFGDPGENPCVPGECDNLEATVSSIDWLGDGSPPDAAESYPHMEPDLPLQTNVWYEDPTDAEATRQHVVDRLSDAGFEPVPDRKSSFQGDEWQVRVGVLIGADPPLVKVTVDIVDNDARAAEILAPIVDALGTIP